MVGMLDSLSLKNTKLGLETLELMGYDPSSIKLVLNRAAQPRRHHAERRRRRPRPRARHLVPSDREIPRAVNEGVPIVTSQARLGGRAGVPAAR